ncbi:MAG: hypothetical protein ACK4NC_03315 [Candidatus Gracilibacteria bacterium]
MENSLERYLTEKGRFYNKYANGDFEPIKTFFKEFSRSKAMSGAEELKHSHTYRVLLRKEKDYLVKIPKTQMSYSEVISELEAIQKYNKEQHRNPILFPTTEVVLFQKDPELFYIKQEYIPGRHLSLSDLTDSEDLQLQFKRMLMGAFKVLQTQEASQSITYACTIQNLLTSLKFALVGKEKSLEEILRNFIVDKHGRIRIVSLYVLEMDIEALHFDINNKIRKTLKSSKIVEKTTEGRVEIV